MTKPERLRSPDGVVHVRARYVTSFTRWAQCEADANRATWDNNEMVLTFAPANCLACIGAAPS